MAFLASFKGAKSKNHMDGAARYGATYGRARCPTSKWPPVAERSEAGTDAPQRYAAPEAAAIRLAGLAVEVGMLREQLGDTRRDRDAWRDQAQRLALPSPVPERMP